MNFSNNESRLKILLVDDEPANIVLLKKMLSTKGYDNILTTLDSKKVVSLFKEYKFDLIFLDINMPTMNGYEVLSELKKLEFLGDTQVIAITGDIDPDDIDKGLEAGFSDYITKPIKISTIIQSADNALQILSC